MPWMLPLDRFTDRAKKVIALAKQEACRLNHEYLGTEHLLLGLILEREGVAAEVLKNLKVDLKRVREVVMSIVQEGPSAVVMGNLPRTPRATKALELGVLEADKLDHEYIGTEHILLGLIRARDGVAGQVLLNLGLKLEMVRGMVLEILEADIPSEGPEELFSEVRPELKRFAMEMERTLAKHDEKKGIHGWRKSNVHQLLACLESEIGELKKAIAYRKHGGLVRESIDIANQAMMLHDLAVYVMVKKGRGWERD